MQYKQVAAMAAVLGLAFVLSTSGPYQAFASPPSLSASSQSVSVDENGSVGITLAGNGPSNFTYVVATQPAHGVLTGTAPNLAYTPDTNYFGSDSFTFHTHKGGNDSTDATVSITVNEVVVTPSSDNGSGSGDSGSGSGTNSTDTSSRTNSTDTGNGGNNSGDNSPPHSSNSRNWADAEMIADALDGKTIPESTSGVSFYDATQGHLGMHFFEVLMSTDLTGAHYTDGQYVYILEHFDELVGGSQ